jgi:hypothetical protein
VHELCPTLLRGLQNGVHNDAAFGKGPAMDDSALVYAAVFLVGVALICGMLFLLILHRVSSTSEARRRRRKSSRRAAAAHRAFKDVL